MYMQLPSLLAIRLSNHDRVDVSHMEHLDT